MATIRKPKAVLDLEKRVAELEKKLATVEAQKDSYWKLYQEEKTVTDGLHEVLDDLGIRGYKDDSKYQRVPLLVRLFAWAMKSEK